MMSIGKRIKKLRENRGLTQAEVSEGILSTSHYSNIERGRFRPSNSTLELLSKKFSVPVNYLILTENPDETIKIKLNQFNLLIENGDMMEAKLFLETNKDALQYISCFKQESEFQLIYCHFLFKNRNVKCFKQSFEDFLKNDTENLLTSALENKFQYLSGIYYFYSKKYKEAIAVFLSYIKNDIDSRTSAQISFNLSLCYHKLNRYSTSLKWAHRSLLNYLQLHDWSNAAQCHNMCGLLLRNLGKVEEAEKELRLGLSLITNPKDITYAKIYHNLALLYNDQKNFMKALEMVDKSINIKETQKQYNELFISYKVKTEVLLKMTKISEATNVIQNLHQMATSKRDKYIIISLESRLNLILGKEKEYVQGMRACIKFFKKNKEWIVLQEHAEELSNYLASQSQYKEAYDLLLIAYEAKSQS